MTVNAILCAIDELESNGLATRPWAMAGLYLALCQKCERWAGTGCPDVSIEPGRFAEFLVDGSRSCRRWDTRPTL